MIVDQRIERPTERLTDLLTYQIILYMWWYTVIADIAAQAIRSQTARNSSAKSQEKDKS